MSDVERSAAPAEGGLLSRAVSRRQVLRGGLIAGGPFDLTRDAGRQPASRFVDARRTGSRAGRQRNARIGLSLSCGAANEPTELAAGEREAAGACLPRQNRRL